MRVLVVEDSAYQRLRIVEALRGAAGVGEVEAVGTGEEAIRRLLTHEFGLVTLDLGLPGMDGHAVLRWIMANRPLPVVVISSDREERSALAALEAGALDVLPKAGAQPESLARWRKRLGEVVEGARSMSMESLLRRSASRASEPPVSGAIPRPARPPLTSVPLPASSSPLPPAVHRPSESSSSACPRRTPWSASRSTCRLRSRGLWRSGSRPELPGTCARP
ncbi:MAG: response regulator [Holophagales bacterium]|nr:response regulator [Holophagales bacterium]